MINGIDFSNIVLNLSGSVANSGIAGQGNSSDIVSSTLSNVSFPVDPNALVANFVNNPNSRSYQPRAYANEYSIPERIDQYTASVQRELPGNMSATAAYVGSQGRNPFLRSVANNIVQVLTNPNPASAALVNPRVLHTRAQRCRQHHETRDTTLGRSTFMSAGCARNSDQPAHSLRLSRHLATASLNPDSRRRVGQSDNPHGIYENETRKSPGSCTG